MCGRGTNGFRVCVFRFTGFTDLMSWVSRLRGQGFTLNPKSTGARELAERPRRGLSMAFTGRQLSVALSVAASEVWLFPKIRVTILGGPHNTDWIGVYIWVPQSRKLPLQKAISS